MCACERIVFISSYLLFASTDKGNDKKAQNQSYGNQYQPNKTEYSQHWGETAYPNHIGY